MDTREPPFDQRWNGVSIPRHEWHFHQRLWERYAVVMAPGEFADLLRALRDGRAECIKRRRCGVRIYTHKLAVCSKRIFVEVMRNRLITAFPPDLMFYMMRSEAKRQRKLLASLSANAADS